MLNDYSPPFYVGLMTFLIKDWIVSFSPLILNKYNKISKHEFYSLWVETKSFLFM